MNTLKRNVAGVKVRFYKRTAKANFTMDFQYEGERFQETTRHSHIVEAERIALDKIEQIKAIRFSRGSEARVRGAMATVGEVRDALEHGDKVMDDKTRNRYIAALLRLARLVDDRAPEAVTLDRVVNRTLLERFVSLEQGADGRGVNWHDELECNGGINSTLRNAASCFQERLLDRHLKGLRLPPLDPLRKFRPLPTLPTHFVPWPEANVQAMDEAARLLKAEDPELWLCHAMLRRLGLRNGELEFARASWIEWGTDGKAWLNVKTRKAEGDEPAFSLLKNGGKPRRLSLDAELQEVLRERTGWLIGEGWGPSKRHDFIYRAHCDWLRPFVPSGREKVNHELRKLSASRVYTQHGIAAAAYFLGDSVTTTERFYAAWTAEAPVIAWDV